MSEHWFDGERCVFCGVNRYDCFADEDYLCEHPPVQYTSETEADR